MQKLIKNFNNIKRNIILLCYSLPNLSESVALLLNIGSFVTIRSIILENGGSKRSEIFHRRYWWLDLQKLFPVLSNLSGVPFMIFIFMVCLDFSSYNTDANWMKCYRLMGISSTCAYYLTVEYCLTHIFCWMIFRWVMALE
jgi:hypothetical protein